jgi:hypothetical protein
MKMRITSRYRKRTLKKQMRNHRVMTIVTNMCMDITELMRSIYWKGRNYHLRLTMTCLSRSFGLKWHRKDTFKECLLLLFGHRSIL